MKNPKNIIIALLVVALILLLLKYCSGGNGNGTTIVKIDTVYKEVRQDTAYIPKIDTVLFTRTTTRDVPYRVFDTLYLPHLVELEVDTALILSDYFKANIYKDTLKNEYGYIAVTDTITRNKVYGRGWSSKLLIPEITKTITIYPKQKNQLYVGAGLLGNEKDFLSGYEVNLSLKTKQDRIIGIGYNQLFNTGHYYKLEYRHKLSFKK